MKVFVTRVEQHIYPIIEDHYTWLKVFTNAEIAEEWARSECERIMHEELDQYIDDEDSDTYQWEHTDYGSSFVSNFSWTENDENHFCCWKVDEEVVCGTEYTKETVVASIADFAIRGYEIRGLSDEDKEQLLESVYDSMNNNDCVMDCFWLTIDCVAEEFGLEKSK